MEIQNKPESVYQPREDSYFLLGYIKKFSKGAKVLDMGTGTGIHAIGACKSGAEKVVAVDINPKAVELAGKNAKKNECEIEVKKSDLFDNVEGKFDLIVFNPPYLPLDQSFDNEKIRRAVFGGGTGKEVLIKFLFQAKRHLKKGGVILVLISSKTGKDGVLEEISDRGFQAELLGIKKLAFEKLFALKLENEK